MQAELELTQKQYNKVYKFFLQEEKGHLQTGAGFGRPGPPPGEKREGSPPERNRKFSSGRPRVRMIGDPEQLQKATEKKEKKMKKILTAEQYEKWSSLEKEKERKKLPWGLKEE